MEEMKELVGNEMNSAFEPNHEELRATVDVPEPGEPVSRRTRPRCFIQRSLGRALPRYCCASIRHDLEALLV